MKRFTVHCCALALASLVIGASVRTGQAMNFVRAETRVDNAVARYGVSGSNTLVAIFDRGLDWKHPDFRNPDGTTRIEFIFDLTDDSGASAPGNPYGMGTIYTKAQIDDALQNGTNLPTRDAVGHGTSTAGIACGGGRIIPLYRGVAPGARIIVVKITSDFKAVQHGHHDVEQNHVGAAASDFFERFLAIVGFLDVESCGVISNASPIATAAPRASTRWRSPNPRLPGVYQNEKTRDVR
jgi:hypothetical protein